MFIDNLPKTRGIRVVRHAFEDQASGAIGQRPVNDIAVPGDPANVGGAPVNVTFVVVEYVLVGHRGHQQVAAGAVQHPLGLTGGAGGVEDKQRVFGVHWLGWAIAVCFAQGLVVPNVAPFNPVDFTLGTFDHHHRGDRRAALQGFVDVGLERYVFATAYAFIGSDHRAAIGIKNTVTQRIR